MRFDALNLYYVHGRWYNPDTGLFLSPDANGEYRYGSGQDAVNKVWTQFVTGAAYQAVKNNADAIALVLFVSPGYRTLYEQTFNNIEETLPDTFPFHFGRLFGTTVTLVQGLGEITTLGPGIIGGGSAATCLATVGGGCIPGVSVSTAVGSAVIVHGLSVEAASLYNGSQLIIAFARKSDTETPGPTTYRDRFYQKYPNAPRDYKIHHRIPQKAREMGKFPPEVVDSIDNLRAVPEQIHWQINSEWANFWRRNPNPTQKQILDFAQHIDKVFGQFFWQP